MTNSIVARDPDTGEMGVACQSQALAIGGSVPWALAGYGVVATQSMGEPMYGELGLDSLQSGLTAEEALTALRSVDPHPERRQVAMVDARGNLDVYTGSACVAEAGHRLGEGCAALANMAASADVWHAMVERYEQTGGSLAHRLLAALRAAEERGGDFRGRRSASIAVVRARRSGRPWRDEIVDLRVDDHPEPVGELERLLRRSARYHQMVGAFEAAIDGDPQGGMAQVQALEPVDVDDEPDLGAWKVVVLALAGDTERARALLDELGASAPQFLEVVRRWGAVGVLGDAAAQLFPPGR